MLMTTKKAVLIVILSIISIPILLTLMNIGNNFRKNIIADKEIQIARQLAEGLTDKKVSEAKNLLTESGIAVDDIESSKIDVCYVNHSDAGWMASNWYQDCYLRYVNGFATDLASQDVKQMLMTNPKTSAYFGDEDAVLIFTQRLYCGLFEKDHSTTLVYRPANLGYDEDGCEIPSPYQSVSSVRGPIILDDELSVRTYKIFNPLEVDNSRNQIWTIFDEHYYHEELGCGTGFIFCSNPRSTPVHPTI